MSKLSENSIRIKELIKEEVCMGTYGLVELELLSLDNKLQGVEAEVKKLITRVETEINKTPTGELRNLLCDVNMILHMSC